MSAADIKHEFENLRQCFFLEETEDNWEKIAKAMQSFVKVGDEGGHEPSAEVINALRNFHRPIVNAMHSERTRLCGTALDLLTSAASGLERDFEQVMPLFMPPLLSLCGKMNKVVINRARSTILSIIESTQFPSSLPYFVQFVKDKVPTLRLVVAEGTLACLNSCNPPDLEKEARARDVETIIRGTARDANSDVRNVSRKIFQSYKILFPSRVESFTAPLSPTMKKYLDIKPGTITTSKSTTHLRDQFKQDSKPSNSATSTKPQFSGHARTASVSDATAAQSKTLASKLTRVTRKDPISGRPLSAQDLQLYRPMPESQKSHARTGSTATLASGPSRAISKAESKSLVGPVTSQPNTLSRITGLIASEAVATAPRRFESKFSTVQPLVATISGPKRVPMPPPAPKKEQAGPRRPASRVDSTASTASTGKAMVPVPAPSKKSATTSTSTKERPPITKPPVPKFKPTANPTSSGPPPATTTKSGSTKPLAVNKKPAWGRSVPASNSQKVPVKPVVKKPSSAVLKPASTTAVPMKRPVTPAMIALPPSPIPAEANVATARATDHADAEADIHETSNKDLPSDLNYDLSPPVLEVSTLNRDKDQTTSNGTPTSTHASVSPVDSRLSTPTNEETEVVVSHNLETQGFDTPELRLSGTTEHAPCTPQSNLLPNPVALNATVLAAKTPISALLSSIERGFLYSPTTPLSPADSYLPGPNGTITYSHETHAPRIEGPMQPFNYALHATPKGAVFSNASISQQGMKLVCGSIGVVDVNEHDKLYGMTTGLPRPDDPNRMRNVFVEPTQSE